MDERSDPGGDADEAAERFEALRALRRALAAERGVPAFCVLPDASLRLLAEAQPQDAAALREVPGLGPKKVALYGEALLALLRKT